MDVKHMSDAEIQEAFRVLDEELVRRQRARRASIASGVLDALEELVKVAPYYFIDMSDDPDVDESPVYFKSIVRQWNAQNFHFD